jgi:predicted MPP superfamily phosphohydrolase
MKALWVSARVILSGAGLLPLLTLLIAAVVANRAWLSIPSPVDGRRLDAWSVTFLVTAMWGLDFGLLWLLPRLGLSYGAWSLPVFGMTLVRLVAFACVGVVWDTLRRHWTWAAMPTGLWTGVGILAVVNLAITGLAVYAFAIEPFKLGVTEIQVDGPAFFNDRSLRVLQISDLHVERITPRERQVLAQVKLLQPDLIVLTGDYLNLDYLGDPTARVQTRELLSALEAPYGVFAVNGSVDSLQMMQELFSDLPIQVLKDETQILYINGNALAIIGISDTERQRDAGMLVQAAHELPSDVFSLLLYHTPDLIETASALVIDLYLAGHTHGGQIRLPFYGALITASAYGKTYEMGRYTLGETSLYVSRGLGMEGFGMPRARFLCPPELVLVDIGGPQIP